jgi:hypothetical protein
MEETKTEVHHVKGEQLLSKVRELVKEGRMRRLIIKTAEGHTVLEIPLAIGVAAALVNPTIVALAAIGALAADYTVIVEKHEGTPS